MLNLLSNYLKQMNINTLFSNSMIISLGATCVPKIVTLKTGVQQPTQFFDWLGTSAYSLVNILTQDSPEILENDFYPKGSNMAVYYSCRRDTIVDKKHKLIFIHDKEINNTKL